MFSMKPKALLIVTVVLGAILTLVLARPAAFAAKKEPPPPAPPKSRFLIRLSPANPGAAATEEMKARIVMHFDYLKTLLPDGKLVLAGMSTDDFTEILLIEAADREEAERIMTSDPAVSGSVYQAELHPFRVVLSRQEP
ncbi:MAG: YciI family protein, partial [Acidobacteria bacterium]|nr:YciI family protein [Acidobacteriota bacterium]